ncbi:MAG TPA: T9SS type B sorting domain-containing protein [Bacteroidetes bacterium]|nr:T9SS type B sorting domain-containing protein [Bacteroidota bacterium]
MVKQFTHYIFIFIALIFMSNKLMATHARALDLYYECIGVDSFMFYVKFYRDCSSTWTQPSSMAVTFNSSTCTNFSRALALSSGPIEVSQLCATALSQSTCNGSNTYPGTIEYIYSGIVVMSQQCDDWIISTSECCRNAAITNLDQGGTTFQDIYSEVSLDNLNFSCNNSTQYSNIPILYGCVGQQLCFNHGATDMDFDSLSFELITTKGDFGNPISFSAGLSLSNPFQTSTPFQFDTLTGQICFTPSTTQYDVLTIKTYEWKKVSGVYTNLGYSTRDLQIVIISSCGSLPPGTITDTLTINSGNLIDSTTLGICAGNTIDFNLNFADTNSTINYLISTNAATATPGATATITGSNPVNIHYNWATPSNAAGQYILSFVVDNSDCPIPQINYLTWIINVQEDLVVNIPDTTICDTAGILDASYPNATYLWSTSETDSAISINTNGLYWVEATKGNCFIRDSAYVVFSQTPDANFNINVNCQLDTSYFTDLSTNAPSSWFWDFGDGTLDSNQNPSHIYIDTGLYQTQLITTTSLGCTDTLTKILVIESPFNIDIGADSSMCGGSLILNASINDNVTYNWSTGETDSAIIVTSSNIYTVEVDNNGCKDRDTAVINIYTLPTTDFSWIGGCVGETIQFSDLSFSNISSWVWDLGDGNSDSIQNPSHIYNIQGTYGVFLQVLDANGCTGSFSSNINIDPKFLISIDPDTILCANSLSINAYGPFNAFYLWSNNIASKTNTVSSSGIYAISITEGSCVLDTFMQVTLLDLPTADFLLEDPCPEIDHQFNNISVGNIIQWEWKVDTNNSTNTQDLNIPLSSGAHSVKLIVTTSDGCVDSITKNIIIYDKSPSLQTSNDTSVYEYYPAYLWASGGLSYTWSPSSTLDDPNISSPTANTLSNTMYYVVIEDSNACYINDSVFVEILDLYNVYVPTAFTPNNDGKNDKFRINGNGIKDYHMIIYDRWGQRVYESHDISESWDGFVKGKDSNLKTYAYYLKLVYLNQNEEIKTGSINMIK